MQLLKDSIIYTLGEIAVKLVPFLLLPYLTRELGIEGFGQLSYYQVYIALGVVFIGFSQGAALYRYYFFYGTKSVGLILVSGYIYSSAVTLVVVCVAIYLESYIIVFVALTALIQEMLASQLALRQCQKKPRQYVFINLSTALLSLIFTILFFELVESSPENRVVAMLLANVLGMLLALGATYKSLDIRFSLRKYLLGVKYILAYGFPLLFHQLSIFTKGQVDRLFIYGNYSLGELGLYSASFQLASVVSVIILALNKALVPYLYESLKNKRLTYQSLRRFAIISIPLVLLPSLFSLILPESLYLFFLGDEYAGSKYYISIFLVGIASSIPYLILVNYFFYHGKTKFISFCTAGSSVLYILYIYVVGQFSLELVPFGLVVFNLIPVSVMLFNKSFLNN